MSPNILKDCVILGKHHVEGSENKNPQNSYHYKFSNFSSRILSKMLNVFFIRYADEYPKNDRNQVAGSNARKKLLNTKKILRISSG